MVIVKNKIVCNEPLARHTTFRIGGPAEYFVQAETRDELIAWTQFAREERLPIFILGNGSNILVSDAGVRGLVIENHADRVEEWKIGALEQSIRALEHWGGEGLCVVAESGASLPGLANRLARMGWHGLEWAIGVPSTVGAAVVNNAGAQGYEIKDCLRQAEVLGPRGEVRWWRNAELQFEYRASFLKAHPGEYVVLRAEFELVRDEPAACLARMSRYTEYRRRTQPSEPSIGSMFKNPPGDYAGRLIEAAGLKGTRIGQVEVSRVHANFFVNLGGATAAQVMELVELTRRRVHEAFGVELELEIQLVGEW